MNLSDDGNEKITAAIEDLLSDNKSNTLIVDTLSLTMPSKKRSFILMVLFLILFTLYILVFVKHGNPILNSIKVVEMVNNISIPIIAVAVTGYSIFQALVNGNTLITLLTVNDKEYSKFKKYNNFFLGFSILFLVIIIANFLINIALVNLSPNWSLPLFTAPINNVLYSLTISLYITFILNALIEVKSFIFNLYSIFIINAASKGLEHIKKQ